MVWKMLRQKLLRLVFACLLLSLLAYAVFLEPSRVLATQALGLPMQTQADPTYGWISISASYRDQQNIVLTNLNYKTGKSEILSRLPVSSAPHFYGVSADGLQVLVGVVAGTQIRFLVLSRATPQGKEVFSQPYNKGDSALWLRDNHSVLISSATTGITKVDTNSRQKTQMIRLPFDGETRLGKLHFIYNDYLYFEGAGKNPDMLARIHMNGSGKIAVLTPRQANTLYWLSPLGTSIYYRATTGANHASALFAINIATGKPEQFRGGNVQAMDDWFPIGFGPQNTLLVARKVGVHIQILDALPFSERAPQIMVDEAAPGAVGIGSADRKEIVVEDNIAVAPYGHAVVVQGTSADGRTRIWSTNLLDHKQVEIPLHASDNSAVKLSGWSKMAVNGR